MVFIGTRLPKSTLKETVIVHRKRVHFQGQKLNPETLPVCQKEIYTDGIDLTQMKELLI